MLSHDAQPAPSLEGLVWHSLAYQPAGPVDAVAGPDTNTRCETPRHPFGEAKPPAEWVEMLWYPHGDKTVARCWKTCEECHVAMAQGADETSKGEPMNTDDMAAAVRVTLGDHPEEFNIPGIVEAIRDEYGEIRSLDDIPTDDYWEIVRAYDGSEQTEE